MLDKLWRFNHLFSQQLRAGILTVVFLGLAVAACSPNESRVVKPGANVTEANEEPIAPVEEDRGNITVDEVKDNLEELIGEVDATASFCRF